jgi:5-methylcytosine-specific restriction endonuclease McrA
MIASVSSGIQSSVLALNRQYLAVHAISVRRAFCLLYKGIAEVVAIEDGVFQSFSFDAWLENSEAKLMLGLAQDDPSDWIQSVNFDIQVPRIIRLLQYDRMPRNTVKFNRRNIFLRDEHRCQYCGKKFPSHRLSLDHVLPRSRNGPTTWQNIVCCCIDCNIRKGGRTPAEAGIKLIRTPQKPTRNPVLYQHLASRKYEMWRTFLNAE